jgi:hypothetical protein
VHPISANLRRQVLVSANQQRQLARTAQVGELPRHAHARARAKMPINHGAPTRQPSRNRDRIRRPLRVGEEIKRWNGRPARIAVEPRRYRR